MCKIWFLAITTLYASLHVCHCFVLCNKFDGNLQISLPQDGQRPSVDICTKSIPLWLKVNVFQVGKSVSTQQPGLRMKRGGSLSPLHLQSTMSKFCICFCQKYQHPPCFTQPIWLDSNYSVFIIVHYGNNEHATLLFHNISLAHAYLRAVTMGAKSNVKGVHQQEDIELT